MTTRLYYNCVFSTVLSTQEYAIFTAFTSSEHWYTYLYSRCISSSMIATAYCQCLCDWKLSFITRKLHVLLCIHTCIILFYCRVGVWVGWVSQAIIAREKEILSPLIVTYPRVVFNPLDDCDITAQMYYGSDVVLNERGRGILVECGRSHLFRWRRWIYCCIGTYKIKKFLISKTMNYKSW